MTVFKPCIGDIEDLTVRMIQGEVMDITLIVVTIKVESELPFFQFSLLKYGYGRNEPYGAQEPKEDKAFHAISLLRSSVCPSTP